MAAVADTEVVATVAVAAAAAMVMAAEDMVRVMEATMGRFLSSSSFLDRFHHFYFYFQLDLCPISSITYARSLVYL